MLSKVNTKLRAAWILLNIFVYAMFIGFSIFVAVNAEGIREIGRFGMWVFMLFLVLLMALFGSYRIWSWIKQGKL